MGRWNKTKLESRLTNAIKEIELEELGEVYFKMIRKYLGYEEHNVSRKYFNDSLYLIWIDTFDDFVTHFKRSNYKII